MVIKFWVQFLFLGLWFGGSAYAQLLTPDEIVSHISGKWVILKSDNHDEALKKCKNESVSIWLEYENDNLIYRSQWSGADRIEKSFIRTLKNDDGFLLPLIILQYEDEERENEKGELVSWKLFMTSKDEFAWQRADWETGHTPFRIRCSLAEVIG